MRKFIIALSVLGAVAGLAAVSAEAAPRGPAKFYDRNGGFRGYAWCLKQGILIFDCNYFNLRAMPEPRRRRSPSTACRIRTRWCRVTIRGRRSRSAAAASKKKVRQQRVY